MGTQRRENYARLRKTPRRHPRRPKNMRLDATSAHGDPRFPRRHWKSTQSVRVARPMPRPVSPRREPRRNSPRTRRRTADYQIEGYRGLRSSPNGRRRRILADDRGWEKHCKRSPYYSIVKTSGDARDRPDECRSTGPGRPNASPPDSSLSLSRNRSSRISTKPSGPATSSLLATVWAPA